MATDTSPSEPLNVYELLAVLTQQLGEVAWMKLGLTPDVQAGRIVKDLPQAKAAVDAVAALVAIIEPELDEDDRRQVQTLITNLRMNYVQKASEAG